MKFTITRINKQNKLCVSTRSVERFLERIAKDDAKQSVANFRMNAPLMNGNYEYYNGIKQWQQVYPAAEFAKDESDNLVFKKSNGLVMIHLVHLQNHDELASAKKAVSLLPMTYAAFEGADGRSLVVLIRILDEKGNTPDNEADCELLYQAAYEQAKTLYLSLVQADIQEEQPTLKAHFMLTLDPSPYLNPQAVAMRINKAHPATPSAPRSVEDLKEYNDYDFLYKKAAEEAVAEMKEADIKWANEDDELLACLSAIAAKLCRVGMSEEEAFIHIRRNNWNDVAEEPLRQLVSSAYATHSKEKGKGKEATKPTSGKKGRADILQMKQYLQSRYQFRYNTVLKYTEYRPNNSWVGDFKPVDSRTMRSMTIDVQLADIHVTLNDVRNFLGSSQIPSYSPIEDFLYDTCGKWDGKDRIRALARTVPTNNPHWEDWFYTWFLGMVDQWRGTYRRQYGNSTMPLLISKQGFNKSTFCRRLVPPSLSWGYNDNLILSEKRQVLQGMAQFLLINLDEFNQISPQVQQGFLKNLLQLPTVKIKPPYGSHVEEFPRLASFIATSNMTDILSDPSGSRRFLGVELTGPIDVSQRINYEQLYAQAMQALERGEKSYFDAEENAEIMQSNLQFQQVSVTKQCFLEVFAPTSDKEKGEYMTAASIFNVLKQKFGSSLKVSNLSHFGRELQNIEGLESKRARYGTEYLVVKR